MKEGISLFSVEVSLGNWQTENLSFGDKCDRAPIHHPEMELEFLGIFPCIEHFPMNP